VGVTYYSIEGTGNSRGIVYKTGSLVIIKTINQHESRHFKYKKHEEHVILINEEYEVAHLRLNSNN
jgi:hypothetical protein